MIGDMLSLLAWPFAAALVFVGIHCWFGLQVLRRQVVFADLALAQLAALGATLAVAVGHPAASPAAYGYALGCAGAGGILLVFSFLVIPAVIGRLFSVRLGIALAIGWGAGLAASALGFVGSFLLDLPTGAATVLGFAAVLVLAGILRWAVAEPRQ